MNGATRLGDVTLDQVSSFLVTFGVFLIAACAVILFVAWIAHGIYEAFR